MQIRHLADYPDAIPQISRWLYDEFGRFNPGASVERGISGLQERLHRNRVPLTLVAVNDEQLVGTVSLVDCDMDIRPDFGPWLADLYVAPEQRRRGIGVLLMDALANEAKRRGIDSLFLFTASSEFFYAKRGWQKIESCFFRNRDVVIMKKHLL